MIDPGKPNFGGTPVAPWRARLDHAPLAAEGAPVVSIVTAIARAAPSLLETLQSLRGQSLQNWRWTLVDDGSRDPESAAVLDLAQRRDARVQLRTLPIQRGLARARNCGVLGTRARYVQLLEAGDLLEATALEKCVWALRSQPAWGFVRTHSIEIADRMKLHGDVPSPDTWIANPPTAGGAMFRRDAFLHAGGFDGGLGDDALEWWDLWLRCADRGLGSGNIAEVLDWWHTPVATPPDRRDAFRATLARRYERLRTRRVPAVRGSTSVPGETASRGSDNPLVPHAKRLLAIVPDLTLDGVSGLLLEMLPLLRKRGWHATIAAARAPAADAIPAFGRISADVHLLDRFLRPADQPRFLLELMQSRRPAWVLVAPGRFGMAVTAYLRSHCATQRFVELRHVDANDADATELSDREATPAEVAAPDLHLCTDPDEASAAESAVHLPLAVDTTVWLPRQPPRTWMRPQWGADPDETVLLFAGRIDHRFRTDVAAATLAALLHRQAPVRLVVAAAGPDLPALREALARAGVADRSVLLGAQPTEAWIKMFSAADVFFAPLEAGSLLAVVRAMACGLPVATATTGALASMIDGSCGIAVAPGDLDAQVRAYADAIEEWARDPASRRRLGRGARERVIARHGPDALALPLLSRLTPSEDRGDREPLPGDPRAADALACLFEWMDTRAACEALRDANDALAARCAALAQRAEGGEAARDWFEAKLREAEAALAARAAQIEAHERQIAHLVASLEWSEEQRRAGRFEQPTAPADARP